MDDKVLFDRRDFLVASGTSLSALGLLGYLIYQDLRVNEDKKRFEDELVFSVYSDIIKNPEDDSNEVYRRLIKSQRWSPVVSRFDRSKFNIVYSTTKKLVGWDSKANADHFIRRKSWTIDSYFEAVEGYTAQY